jgi:hypothetical protein
MRMLLAIPSHNRAYVSLKRLYWLKDFEYDYKIFCEEHQAIYYDQVYGEENIVRTPDGSGLMGQLHQIAKYAEQKNYDLVLKMDDDMRFHVDKGKKEDTGKVVSDYCKLAIEKFSDPVVGMTSVAKYMEYRYGGRSGFVIRKKPVYSNYLTRVKYLKKMIPEMLLFDDLYISIECKLDGKEILTYLGAYEDAVTHKNAGGLQSYKRDEMSRKSFEFAKTLYPKIRELKNPKHGLFDICVKNYF